MTIYRDSKRFVGTNEDRIGVDAISGGWKELDRTTLGSAGDTISVTGLADKRYLMILGSKIPSGSSDLVYRFNADANNNYCCLLYTSPSPRDLSTSRMPSSA